MKRLFSVVVMGIVALGGCKGKAPEAPQAPGPKGDVAQEDAAKAAAPTITGPVARVNGVEIGAAALNQELTKITQGGARNIPEDRLAKIRQNIVNRLVEEELIRQEVERQGVQVTKEEVDAEFERYKGRFKSEEQFNNFLKHGRTSVEEIRARLARSAALNKLLTKLGQLAVSDEDIQKAYESGIKMYTEPEQVHAQHILIKVAENAPADQVEAAKKKAAEAMKRLKKGEDFAAVAKEMSDDAVSREKGGDLGFFRRGVMVPKFEEVAFALKPGEMTKEPVRTPFGFHVIKVLDRKAERVKPLDEVRAQITESLKNRNLFKARRELVERLRKEGKVEVLLPEPPAPAPPPAPATPPAQAQ